MFSWIYVSVNLPLGIIFQYKCHFSMIESWRFNIVIEKYIYIYICTSLYNSEPRAILVLVLINNSSRFNPCFILMMFHIEWDFFSQYSIQNGAIRKLLNSVHGILFVLFLGLEDEGIWMPVYSIRIPLSGIRMLLLASGYSLLYQLRILSFRRESLFSFSDSFVFQ